MQELEKKAYIYSVEAIGFSKSIEKVGIHEPKIEEFRNLSGKLYKLIDDSHKAGSNKEFANYLRQTKDIAQKLSELIPELKTNSNELADQKNQLTDKINEVNNRLKDILSKIIY